MPALVLVLLALSFVSLTSGELKLGAAQLWAGLRGQDELASTVIWQLRLPRLITGMLVGAALASAGLVMQAYFRNSLASPDLLGVSAGAAAGAVSAIVFGWTLFALWVLPLAAVVGAVLATMAVLVLARRGASSERLLLAGIALNALLGAVTSYQLSHGVALWERNAQLLFWLLGGLEDRSWLHVAAALPIVIAAALLWPLGRPMDLLSLGETEAQSLGVPVRSLRRRLLALATVLAATATAVAGVVGFVGLVVPHCLRLLVGPEHRRLVPLSIMGGAAFVLACDLVGRVAGNLRLGIVTALVGGPFFL
ncbi:MAG: iron ABC transporter permease, partial [Opitutaceae bacterium]|nr:iron ABC transporter permease [Opitutaceae bacterium]